MSDKRRDTGQQGELIARSYLERKGYTVIAINWRCRDGEIDLIAIDRAVLVFVEVRTRRSRMRGSAAESITPAKQRRLARLAYAYLQDLEQHGSSWQGDWRIDVLALHLSATGTAHIQHLQHAVQDIV